MIVESLLFWHISKGLDYEQNGFFIKRKKIASNINELSVIDC